MFLPSLMCKNLEREIIQLKYDKDCECSICLSDMKNKKVKYLRCGHVFHIRCINKWLNSKQCCPICRTRIGNKEKSLEELVDEILADHYNNSLWPDIMQFPSPHSPLDSPYDESSSDSFSHTLPDQSPDFSSPDILPDIFPFLDDGID